MTTPSAPSSPTFPIGVVARETGVPVETLRTWERRYGFPSPVRDDGGRRLYSSESVIHVRLAAEAIRTGHKASHVLKLGIHDLKLLIGVGDQSADSPTNVTNMESRRPVPMVVPSADPAGQWVHHARGLDGDSLDIAFRSSWSELGGVRFINERATPFLIALGEAWATGRIEVYHEHFASERLRDFLVSTWRPMADSARGPSVVCTTLPGERHSLGLHLVASILAMSGLRITFLGSDTPVEDIIRSVGQSDSIGVVLSISRFSDGENVRDSLRALRRRLPADRAIIVGGAGAPSDIAGITFCESINALFEWGRASLQSARNAGE